MMSALQAVNSMSKRSFIWWYM